MNVDIFHQ